ncbi:hypothetical protein J5N97_025243 [Dioscorea zingiberensis]|uniref:Uncharacterized protein n=1 Tax=Dioscorea zingiberensis TaxID=325984 RepID=A0A9D5H9D3_9LILI|nr:hypothetical protein J5N97_025243 [Dioscorea zingiberensis]
MRESHSPRDDDNHGTYTATTSTGSPISSTNLLGYVIGMAHGMATHARLADYKVYWAGGFFSFDILAAMESDVANGYHVLLISICSGMTPYYSTWNGYLLPLSAIRMATIQMTVHSPARRYDGCGRGVKDSAGEPRSGSQIPSRLRDTGEPRKTTGD